MELQRQESEISFLQKLRTARLMIFQAPSLEQLKGLIRTQLADLCAVHSISIREKKKKSSGRYYFYNTRLSSKPDHFVCFKREHAYSGEEKKFLSKIARSIDVSMKRLETYRRLHMFKKQWKSAFNAIQKPICLTDSQFRVLSSNLSFLSFVQKTKQQVYRKNCFSVFFQTLPSEEEQKTLLKSKILKSIRGGNQVFEVYCQSILKERQKGSVVRLLIFTDISRKIEMEKKINRLADSAEMGVIASSIAHELNNPLAGMRALLELEGSFLLPDEKEMLSAVHRCQHIVEQLLRPNSQFCEGSLNDKSLESFLDSLQSF